MSSLSDIYIVNISLSLWILFLFYKGLPMSTYFFIKSSLLLFFMVSNFWLLHKKSLISPSFQRYFPIICYASFTVITFNLGPQSISSKFFVSLWGIISVSFSHLDMELFQCLLLKWLFLCCIGDFALFSVQVFHTICNICS